jgi:hypothetical protein
VAIALIVLYSVIMMATSGAASWAWIILLAAFVLGAAAAKSATTAKAERRGS